MNSVEGIAALCALFILVAFLIYDYCNGGPRRW